MEDDGAVVCSDANGHHDSITARCHAVKSADSARRGEDGPARAVPVLGDRSHPRRSSYGPDVIGGNGCNPFQEAVAARGWIRACNHTPRRAIPLFDECAREVDTRPHACGPSIG